VGGPADVFVKLTILADLPHLINYVNEQQLPLVILGKGSNTLPSDNGFRGVVCVLPHRGIITESRHGKNVTLKIDAGTVLSSLIQDCKRMSVGGLEPLVGIPGTLGGAIVSNAGAHGCEIGTFVDSLNCIHKRTGKTKTFQKAECKFAYRSSLFSTHRDWIIQIINLVFSPVPFSSEKVKEFKEWRYSAQPVKLPNAGSIFKNPNGQFAGALIEKYIGKGFRIGQVAISEQHANIFVNLGGATAEQFRELIAHVKNVVYDKTGIRLEEEIIIL